MSTLEDALSHATARLRPLHESARLDAEVLLAALLGRDRSHLRAWPERELPSATAAEFAALVERRAAGEPVAYLTGRREFWSLSLKVTPDTLIPRPETELLVEAALAQIPEQAAWPIADLGTGSGAVALAIARERPQCRVVAIDLSAAALAVARENAATLGIGNVEFRAGSWCRPLAGERYRIIVSNPPYVVGGDPHLTQGDARFEPRTALQAGPDGLDAIRIIAFQARGHLDPGGGLLLEHGFEQGPAVRKLLERYGYAAVRTHQDLAGRPRVSSGTVPSATP